MSDLLKKAQELAELLEICPEAKKAKETEEIQLKDEKAQEMIKAYNDMRRDAAVKMQCSELSDEENKKMMNELNEAFDKLMEYDVIKNYVDAQREYEQLKQNIINTVAGSYGGCGGSCSSCSGCH